MTATRTRRTLLMLLRDARGRFLRLRTPVVERPTPQRRRRPSRRPVLAAVQLALF